MKTVSDLRQQFESWQMATIEARELSERDQDYDDHHQWSPEEIELLEARNQAPVVINRAKTKINLLTGLQRMRRTMPRALPRTPQHEQAADATTEALRLVAQNTNFEMTSSAAFREKLVQGYGGAIVETETRGGEVWVAINRILWDRYYYDPYSRELDFSDKSFDGIVIWMERQDAKDTWSDKSKQIDDLIDSDTVDDTTDDKPIWIDQKRDRIKVCQHFYKEGGTWMMCFFSGHLFLTEPAPSPFLDEFGEPQNPIEMETAYIDRDLNRYGEMRSYIWIQDEINHRRSRLLYAGSVQRVVMEEGAVEDENAVKQQLARADGIIKHNKGFEFEIMPNDDISAVQMALLQESKAEIDEVGANPALAGKGKSRSGRQDQLQQQAGQAELAQLFDGHRDWENRIYRQVFNRIKQHWTAEKWIRVTDDKSDLEWVGLNQPIKRGDLLAEAAQEGNEEAKQVLDAMIANRDPRLEEVVEIENNVAEMDVDIIITDAPKHATIQQETFDTMMSLAERYGPDNVPFEVALELSDMPNKKEAKKLLNPPPDPKQLEIQEIMLKLDLGQKEADIAVDKADAALKAAKAEAQDIENKLTIDRYPNIVADRNSETVMKQLDNEQKQVETIKLATDDDVQANVSV